MPLSSSHLFVSHHWSSPHCKASPLTASPPCSQPPTASSSSSARDPPSAAGRVGHSIGSKEAAAAFPRGSGVAKGKTTHRHWWKSLGFAPHSLGEMVMQLRSTQRRGPVARGLAWLRRARDTGLRLTQGGLPPSRLGTAEGSAAQAGLWGDSGLERPLLPVHLPPRPASLSPEVSQKRSSRRKAHRWRTRCLSFELLEWQLAAFNYWELGFPKNSRLESRHGHLDIDAPPVGELRGPDGC